MRCGQRGAVRAEKRQLSPWLTHEGAIAERQFMRTLVRQSRELLGALGQVEAGTGRAVEPALLSAIGANPVGRKFNAAPNPLRSKRKVNGAAELVGD